MKINAAYRWLMLGGVLLLSACSSEKTSPPADKSSVVATITRGMPRSAVATAGWQNAIYHALDHQKIATSPENLCAVIAVIGQESNFHSDAPVQGLSKIAWQEIDRRASALFIPHFAIRAALNLTSADGRSYTERLDKVKTEKELSDIFDDLIDMAPLGHRLFGRFNPIHTGGPMQVSIAFAEQHARHYPYPIPTTIRKEVFTQRGGVYFGALHLLGYPSAYTAAIYRFADYNAGWYASRNAAFQAALSYLSNRRLSLDGDLIQYGSDQAGKTELAARGISTRLGMSDKALRRDLERGEQDDFDQTRLWQQVFLLVEARSGRAWPRARLPGIKLESPKITRNLTTAWFAQRVNLRYTQCLHQIRGQQ